LNKGKEDLYMLTENNQTQVYSLTTRLLIACGAIGRLDGVIVDGDIGNGNIGNCDIGNCNIGNCNGG